MQKILKSFNAALKGVTLASRQRNFRIQIIATICAVVTALLLNFTFAEFLLILLLINNVLSAEGFNSAIEDLSDRQKELGLPYDKAGTSRDLAAGAVLINAITAFIIGLAILLPRLKLFIG
ncbi:MAG: diacylglycerol kinase family protein [Candidatus Dojkabacteria bacterium]